MGDAGQAQGGGSTAATTSRRQLLVRAAGAAAAAATVGWGPTRAWATVGHVRPRLPAGLFALGVASGDPDPSSVVLWTRLAPAPLAGGGMPPGDVTVHWEVAHDDR